MNNSFDGLRADALPLYTDFYELTMGYAYWKHNRHQMRAVFYVFFRENPFEGGYVVSSGQRSIAEYLDRYRFDTVALDFLAHQKDTDGRPLFEDGFLSYLQNLRLEIEIEAPQEGEVVFPYEPVLKISGPILECQLLEGPLLNIFGFQSLIATKAARIVIEAHPDPVMEFGLRRAHGLQAASWASRAAYIGGVDSTSNVAAGLQYGIPLMGTHAHSWIMSFDDERTAFRAYASAMPNNCVLLVDTYDTRQGIQHAIEVAKEMASQGRRLHAIRIDSGDLTYLSQIARRALNEEGLEDVGIIASGDIDEHIIASLKQQKATISAWGVGTQLSTAFTQPALGAVYKLAAIEEKDGWRGVMKLSDSSQKVSIPGILSVSRFREPEGLIVADMISDQSLTTKDEYTIISPHDPVKRRKLSTRKLDEEPLLHPLPRPSTPVVQALEEARHYAAAALDRLHPSIRRIKNPHTYPVGLEQNLYNTRIRMIEERLDTR